MYHQSAGKRWLEIAGTDGRTDGQTSCGEVLIASLLLPLLLLLLLRFSSRTEYDLSLFRVARSSPRRRP